MSEWEYESGIADHYYVVLEIYDNNGKKLSLSVNPIGQFSPGGCCALVYVKKEQLLSLTSAEVIMDYFLKKICLKNLETAVDLKDDSLGNVLQYTADLKEDEENDWWLPYFRRLERKLSSFRDDLVKMEKENGIRRIRIHQYHGAAGELCDFVDYTCCPEGEGQEVIRSFFEEKLDSQSDIDAIMDCFEDGYFYGSAYESDRLIEADLLKQTVQEKLLITEIH